MVVWSRSEHTVWAANPLQLVSLNVLFLSFIWPKSCSSGVARRFTSPRRLVISPWRIQIWVLRDFLSTTFLAFLISLKAKSLRWYKQPAVRFDYLVLGRLLRFLTLFWVTPLLLSWLVTRFWLGKDPVYYALFCLSIFSVKLFDSIGNCKLHLSCRRFDCKHKCMVECLLSQTIELVVPFGQTNNSGFLVWWNFINSIKTSLSYGIGFVEFLSCCMLGGSDTVWWNVRSLTSFLASFPLKRLDTHEIAHSRQLLNSLTSISMHLCRIL